jgi:hypothetical protein
MNRKSLRGALCAALLAALALCVVPALASASAKSEKRQNTAIKRGAKAIKKTAGAVTTLAKGVKGIDDRLKTIEGAAPQIIDGLGALKDGLTQLKTGLETAGAGLNKLKTLASSTEYGFGQVIVISAGPVAHPQVGSFVVTPDIPDAVQQAQTTQQFVNGPDVGNVLVRWGVRSGESDGDGTTAAANCRITVTNAGGTTEVNGGTPPFAPALTKSSLTSTVPANAGFPFGLKTAAPDADVTQDFATTVPVAAGATYTVGMSCVDITPNADDPSA